MCVLTFCVHLYIAGFYYYVIPISSKISVWTDFFNPWDYKDEQCLVLTDLTVCILMMKT